MVSGDILIPAYYRQLFGCYETSIKSCDKYYEVKFFVLSEFKKYDHLCFI